MIQFIIAAAMGLAILLAGRWAVRLIATPPPDDLDPEDVVEVEALFRCDMCGLRLTVTHAQGEDVAPPRHCHEEMEQVSRQP